jgi:VIT1/CCC1 family predicted Fe2+/Mn2+ transporter
MPLPPAPDQKPNVPARRLAASLLKANNELLVKGLLCLLIGAGVLVSPYFITSPGMQSIVAQSSLVGWFAVVLGAAFVGLYARRRMAAAAKS